MRTLEVTKLRDLTGPGNTDESGMGGSGLGAAATAPDGRIVAVFGDTFESGEAGGPGWRSGILFGDPGSVRSGLMSTDSAGPSGATRTRSSATGTTRGSVAHSVG